MITFLISVYASIALIYLIVRKWNDYSELRGLFLFLFCIAVIAALVSPTSISNGTIRETIRKEDGSFMIFTDKDDTIFIWDGEDVEVIFNKEMCAVYQSGDYQIIRESQVNWYGGSFDSKTKFIKP